MNIYREILNIDLPPGKERRCQPEAVNNLVKARSSIFVWLNYICLASLCNSAKEDPALDFLPSLRYLGASSSRSIAWEEYLDICAAATVKDSKRLVAAFADSIADLKCTAVSVYDGDTHKSEFTKLVALKVPFDTSVPKAELLRWNCLGL